MLLTGYQPGYPLKKIKLFDTNLAPIISNLANGRVSIKSNNSVLVQKYSSSLYNGFDR